MKYDFTSIMDRRGRDAVAVDALGVLSFAPGAPREGFDAIPMWVADMNFPTVPTVPETIRERTAHPAYGYFMPREEYFDAILRWQERRHGVVGLEKRHIGHENGVLGGVVSALRVLCSRGDSVLIHSPTYVGFTSALEGNGFRLVCSPLRLDDDGIWRMDYADMERKIAEHHIHAAVFCSPHNPCGRVWEREELEKAMEIFRRHDVFVVSDEIWADIVRPGLRHIPLQSVSQDARQRTAAFYAPSKTFNLAGLTGAYHIVYNDWLRERMEKEASLSHYNGMNLLSMYALIGAYRDEGAEWLDELNRVLAGNVDYACETIRTRFDGVEVSPPQGTYILFADCTKWCAARGKTLQELERSLWDVGVAVQDGAMFHGPCHLRINLALPRFRVEEAFRRMDEYVFNA